MAPPPLGRPASEGPSDCAGQVPLPVVVYQSEAVHNPVNFGGPSADLYAQLVGQFCGGLSEGLGLGPGLGPGPSLTQIILSSHMAFGELWSVQSHVPCVEASFCLHLKPAYFEVLQSLSFMQGLL